MFLGIYIYVDILFYIKEGFSLFLSKTYNTIHTYFYDFSMLKFFYLYLGNVYTFLFFPKELFKMWLVDIRYPWGFNSFSIYRMYLHFSNHNISSTVGYHCSPTILRNTDVFLQNTMSFGIQPNYIFSSCCDWYTWYINTKNVSFPSDIKITAEHNTLMHGIKHNPKNLARIAARIYHFSYPDNWVVTGPEVCFSNETLRACYYLRWYGPYEY